MKIPWCVIPVLVFASGCSNFNSPFDTSELFVVGNASAPNLQYIKLNSNRDALELVGTLTSAVAGGFLFPGTGLLALSGGTNIGTLSALASTRTLLTARNVGSIVGLALSPQRDVLYYASAANSIKVRSLSAGTLASSDLQAFNASFAGDSAVAFAFSSDSSFMVVGDDASSDSTKSVHVVTRGSDGQLLTVAASGFGSPDPVDWIANVPALGTEYYLTYTSGANIRLMHANASSVSLAASWGATPYCAVHPTQPWIFIADSTTSWSRLLATTSTLTLAATTTVPTRTVSWFPVFSADGDRLVELTGTTLRLYSVSL